MPQLSQNLKALLQEVGEGAALINLAVRMTDKPGWTLFKNYSVTGCDLVVQRLDSNHEVSQLKIEVKTHQNVVTDRTNRNAVHPSSTVPQKRSLIYKEFAQRRSTTKGSAGGSGWFFDGQC